MASGSKPPPPTCLSKRCTVQYLIREVLMLTWMKPVKLARCRFSAADYSNMEEQSRSCCLGLLHGAVVRPADVLKGDGPITRANNGIKCSLESFAAVCLTLLVLWLN